MSFINDSKTWCCSDDYLGCSDEDNFVVEDEILYAIRHLDSDRIEYFCPDEDEEDNYKYEFMFDGEFYFQNNLSDRINQLETIEAATYIKFIRICTNFITKNDDHFEMLKKFLAEKNNVNEVYFINASCNVFHDISKIIDLIKVFRGPFVKVELINSDYSSTNIDKFIECIAESSNIKYFKLASSFELIQDVLESIQYCENMQYIDLHIYQSKCMNVVDVLNLSTRLLNIVSKLNLKYFGLFYDYLSKEIFNLVKPILKSALSENYFLLYCRTGRTLLPQYINDTYLNDIIKRNLSILKNLRYNKIKSLSEN